MALTLAGSNIDVHIDDPLASNNESMKTLLPNLYFHILYWEGPSFSQVEPPPPRFPFSVPPLDTPAASSPAGSPPASCLRCGDGHHFLC